MPGVEGQNTIECPFAGFGVVELASIICPGHRVEQSDPSLVDRSQQSQRNIDRQLRVAQLGPPVLVIRFNGRFIFCQRPFETYQSVAMAVRHVMGSVPDCPAAGAIRSIELPIVEAVHRRGKLFRKIFEDLDPLQPSFS